MLRLIVSVRAWRADVLSEAELDVTAGLVGDTWSRRSPLRDANPNHERARDCADCAVDDRWPLAGDQLYVDLDLADENLSRRYAADARLGGHRRDGGAAHRCRKFSERLASTATKFVNSKEGRRLHLRGINAKVVQSGTIRVGDVASKAPR